MAWAAPAAKAVGGWLGGSGVGQQLFGAALGSMLGGGGGGQQSTTNMLGSAIGQMLGGQGNGIGSLFADVADNNPIEGITAVASPANQLPGLGGIGDMLSSLTDTKIEPPPAPKWGEWLEHADKAAAVYSMLKPDAPQPISRGATFAPVQGGQAGMGPNMFGGFGQFNRPTAGALLAQMQGVR